MNTAPSTPAAAVPMASAPPRSDNLPRDLGWAVLRNTGAQATGRLVVAATRLVIAGLIVRGSGQLTFAEYSLVLAILGIAEWVTDFGLAEVAVREICREPDRRQHLLRVATAAKAIQLPAAYAVLVVLLALLDYPRPVVMAGLLGGLGIVFYGGVAVYRALFKASLTMEREMAAEVLSVLVMVPLIVLAAGRGGGIGTLLACHVVSRGAFLAGAVALGGGRFRLSMAGVSWLEVRHALANAAAIGFVGLLAIVYQTLDILILSQSDLSAVAYYAAAQRLVWPIQMSLAALGASLYTVLASYWPGSVEAFGGTLQRGVDATLVLAGLGLAPFLAAPALFLGIVGPELAEGADVLRVLAALGLVKAFSSTVGPALFVVHAERAALGFILVAVTVKGLALSWVAPRFGYLGVAQAALAVEVFFAALPAVLLLQSLTGYRVRWSVPVRAALITAAAAAGPQMLMGLRGLAAASAAPVLFLALALATRTARLSDLRGLLRWRAR